LRQAAFLMAMPAAAVSLMTLGMVVRRARAATA
jgi:hypothetical protein